MSGCKGKRGTKMLYKQNKTETLPEELFQSPTAEYRGAPFWSWNCKPEKGMLERQMKAFQEMGFGGFHIHSRTGLDVPYLSDEFMDYIKYCVQYADNNGILAWAYDEDRFPSGFAGGLVTKNKAYRYRELFLTFEERTDYLPERPKQRAIESYLIAKFDIILNNDGTLQSYRILNDGEQADGIIWYAYLRIPLEDSWFNNQTYVDTLDKPSIEEFCRVTHERYKEVVGEYFGNVIPSFFTDEPKTTYKKALPFATDRRNLIFPWTDDFPDTFMEKYGFDMIPHIPELVWELPQKNASEARYYYHRHVAERFTESYSRTISDWCEKNGVYLTGHMIKEPTLKSQSTAIGEIMQPLGPFGIPGIDMLTDEREYTTAKQAQSVKHQFNRVGMISELYGVTNWDFDFRGHKLGGDWQAALGVTIRVPHLSWMTMEGEAKRDYPASIHYQSPWYREYKLIEDYFSRVNTAMSRGKAVVKIGVLHPVESYWLHWGTEEHTAAVRKQLDENFQRVTEWLLFEHLDFDFISESILAERGSVEHGKLTVGDMQYNVVLIPGCITIRSSTFHYIQTLKNQGGAVIMAGEPAAYIDAKPSQAVKQLAGGIQCVSMEKQAIAQALDPYRTIKIVDKNGMICNKLIYQMRKDGDTLWVFIVHGKRKQKYDIEGAERIIIHIKGQYEPVVYDAMNGDIKHITYEQCGGETIVQHTFFVHDSLLLQFRPNKKETAIVESVYEQEESQPAIWQKPFEKVKVTLSEPNVYMLDLAEYAVDDEEFSSLEEVLRIGVAMRENYGITAQSGRMAQPWTTEKKKPEHRLRLRYKIKSQIQAHGIMLALEHAADTVIEWNGEVVKSVIKGYYVDEKIHTVALPDLKKGENTLVLTLPFGEGTDVENSFLLGDFGVRVEGTKQEIISPVRELAFGDATVQGLPFYGGNITYEIPIETDRRVDIRTPYYRGALIGVSIDEVRKGSIAFAPYRLVLETEPGNHILGLTLFGTRINTFGTIHNCNENCTWFGPDAWRTKGDSYSYEYQLKKIGILKRPDIC